MVLSLLLRLRCRLTLRQRKVDPGVVRGSLKHHADPPSQATYTSSKMSAKALELEAMVHHRYNTMGACSNRVGVFVP